MRKILKYKGLACVNLVEFDTWQEDLDGHEIGNDEIGMDVVFTDAVGHQKYHLNTANLNSLCPSQHVTCTNAHDPLARLTGKETYVIPEAEKGKAFEDLKILTYTRHL